MVSFVRPSVHPFVLLFIYFISSHLATSVVTSNKAVVWTSVLFHDKALNDIDRENWTPFLNGMYE